MDAIRGRLAAPSGVPGTALTTYRTIEHDREIVAMIVEDGASGLAAAFDQYAQGLYVYCRSRLTEPADVADAVQDTFIIASSKVSGLTQPDRLRVWLFAVARNECHRRLRTAVPSTPLYEAAEAMDDTAQFAAITEQAELRALVRAALAGLNPVEREIIELNLRHELHGADLGDILGVPPNHAHTLASRARSQFEKSLGVLPMARSDRERCPGLAAVLDGGGGKPTLPLRRRIKRHIKRCALCGERTRREVRPAALLSMLTVPALPADLRQRILGLVASPDAAAYRAQVVDRAAPFGADGFPVQLTTPSVPRWQGTSVMAVGRRRHRPDPARRRHVLRRLHLQP